jgi:hypothetical protein
MMRSSSDQYTVAWFTLAECVSRGERERAFGVYRLLSHSLDDKAVAMQLKGDLCYAFRMPTQAIESYQTAVRLYKQSGRLLEAASVCEHIRTIDPYFIQNLSELLDLYCLLQLDIRLQELASTIAITLVQQELYDALWSLVPIIEKLHSFGAQGNCFTTIMYALYNHKNSVIQSHFFAQHATKAYLRHADNALLQQFVAKVKALDDTLYKIVFTIMKDNNYK